MTIEVPLVMSFYADEGNGTAHGNFTVECRSLSSTSKSKTEIFRGVDTYRRTSLGWRCTDRQRTSS